jgi:septum formation protein
MSMPPRIYLASRSPRRRELLHQLHVGFELLLFRSGPREDSDTSEDIQAGESAAEYVCRIALAKARAGVQRVGSRRLVPRLVIAADTTIDLDGEIIGKPDSAEHARAILEQLSGRPHRVLTAVAIADDARVEQALSASEVRFRPLHGEEIERYVATGEPLDKAGAYAIQGRAAVFVEEIRGSHSGIIGLPLFETAQLLKRFGYPV